MFKQLWKTKFNGKDNIVTYLIDFKKHTHGAHYSNLLITVARLEPKFYVQRLSNKVDDISFHINMCC